MPPSHLPSCSPPSLQVVDEEATAKAQEEADAKAKEEGKEGGADKVAPGALSSCPSLPRQQQLVL